MFFSIDNVNLSEAKMVVQFVMGLFLMANLKGSIWSIDFAKFWLLESYVHMKTPRFSHRIFRLFGSP